MKDTRCGRPSNDIYCWRDGAYLLVDAIMTVLYDELVAIDGVADAQVEIVEGGPPSVRLQVQPGADRRMVGESVQQILSQHGLRSRLAPEHTDLELSDAPTPPPTETGNGSNPDAETLEPDSESADLFTDDQDGLEDETSDQHVRRLNSVAVEEERRRVVVTVRDNQDRSAQAIGHSGRRALRDAIVAAVAELVGDGSAVPSVVAIHRTAENSRDIVTVVLGRGAGDLMVGSAFVTVGWEFAFGRAVWAAISN